MLTSPGPDVVIVCQVPAQLAIPEDILGGRADQIRQAGGSPRGVDDRADRADGAMGHGAMAAADAEGTHGASDVPFDESSDMAFGCLGPRSALRARCREIIEHPVVDTLLLLSVIVSSLLLVVDTPRLDPNSELAALLMWLNAVFTIIFTLEAALKATAFGVYWTRFAYLRNGWNVLDFVILVISWG